MNEKTAATAAAEAEREQPSYYAYRGQDVADAFQNFDDEANFKKFDQWAHAGEKDIFVVDYGDEEAWCAWDLNAAQMAKLLRGDRPPSLNTRWINIWKPYNYPDILKVLATNYDFSPRLLGVMLSKPGPPKQKASPSPNASKFSSSLFHRSHISSKSPSTDGSQTLSYSQSSHPSSDVSKLESGIQLSAMSASTGSTEPVDSDPLKSMNHWTMVNEVWHWSSVDWGRKYICLGYNSLHDLRIVGLKPDFGQQSADMPKGIRVWTWLLLCNDKTVITINEDPFPYDRTLRPEQLKALKAIRHNQINVFRQLSKGYDASQDSPIAHLPIRRRIGSSPEESAHRPMDAPGLLFYCLFDDWQTSYSLVVRRYHQYSEELDELRQEMLVTAELSHIERLHRIGRQVAVLKRIYLSYEQIIFRVLEKQEPTAASLKNSHVIGHTDDLSSSTSAIAESQSILGGFLTSAARVRFERLKYRIRLYALSEIDECLDQKESLVMMNFNLIAIKESYSVERLTRVTLLLAKVTILFMPVSLVTGYFSTQLADVRFTQASFWITFAVTFTVSVLALIIFGLYTGTMEGKMLYRPLSKRVVDSWVGRREARKEKARKTA